MIWTVFKSGFYICSFICFEERSSLIMFNFLYWNALSKFDIYWSTHVLNIDCVYSIHCWYVRSDGRNITFKNGAIIKRSIISLTLFQKLGRNFHFVLEIILTWPRKVIYQTFIQNLWRISAKFNINGIFFLKRTCKSFTI